MPFKCDGGQIFQVTNLNRNLTQLRPSEIHCQQIRLNEIIVLDIVTTKIMRWSFKKQS